jgi:AAA+ superfamily predicted ATPase
MGEKGHACLYDSWFLVEKCKKEVKVDKHVIMYNEKEYEVVCQCTHEWSTTGGKLVSEITGSKSKCDKCGYNKWIVENKPIEVKPKVAKKPKQLTTWQVIEAVLPVSRRVLLYGPPGTGKTWAACKYSLGERKTYVMTMTPEMSSAVLVGHYLPEGDKFTWHDGLAIKAWKEGARLIINEVDMCSGDCETILHAILDDPEIAGITLPTGEFVRPKDGFQAVATMNGEPQDLQQAVRDRFPVTISVMEPNPEAIAALPEDLRTFAKETISKDKARNISIRVWAEYGKLRDVIDEDAALKSVFRERADDIRNMIKIAR